MVNSLKSSTIQVASLCFIVIGLSIFVGGCATAPKNVSDGGFEKPDDREYVAIVLSELDNEKETGAYSAGVRQAIGSEKIVPDLPDSIANTIKSDPKALGWVAGVVDTIRDNTDFTDFDTLIVTIPSHTTQTQTYLGFYKREQDAIGTEAYLVDLEDDELVGFNRYFAKYSGAAGESAGLSSITNAGQSAVEDLISK